MARPAIDVAAAKISDSSRLKTAVGNRAQPRAPHQAVRLALDHLVERRRAAGDERGAGDGADHACGIRDLPAGHHVADERRSDDEQVEPRLRERDEVTGAAARLRDARPLRRPSSRPGLSAPSRTANAELRTRDREPRRPNPDRGTWHRLRLDDRPECPEGQDERGPQHERPVHDMERVDERLEAGHHDERPERRLRQRRAARGAPPGGPVPSARVRADTRGRPS